MADKGFRITVLTEEKAVIDDTVLSITAPGTEGYLGVLRNHAPLVTGLQPGKLTIRKLNEQEELYAVAGGFLEISRNTATVLADAIEALSEIDVSRAERAAERARERLSQKDSGIDQVRAQGALSRALNRIRLARVARMG